VIHQFEMRLEREELDWRKCVTCGQVFRWIEVESGLWRGGDGDQGALVQESVANNETTLRVWSTGTQQQFAEFIDSGNSLKIRNGHLSTKDSRFELLCANVHGIRILRPSEAVETIFAFLCTANNHVSRITKMVGWLERQGEHLTTVRGHDLFAFPTLERLAALQESALRKAGFGYRSPRIPGVAIAILELGGLSWLKNLRTNSFFEARIAFMEIRGIGPKIADCISLFGLGHGEAVPIDVHLHRMAAKLYLPELIGLPLTHRRYDQLAGALRERFGKDAGAAHHILFVNSLLSGKAARHE